ncbi:hypothetical protein DSL72_007583 [Monilinia vaccinii-corymbosi]|uniref:Major facilitator superfamily (MFS) profile domain-containing protein n=1 Tax=Monilinia vaccinii-corymbosi TaxID=61207 RepID=A0A8A3PHK2_9HELO|nr:hypothetical protein DSL72_007583 [Monilinia vaccinii-corymbosi]
MAEDETNRSRGRKYQAIQGADSEILDDTRTKSPMEDSKSANEQSTLLSPSDSEGEDGEEGEDEGDPINDSNIFDENPDAFSETKGVWYMILLTLSIGGLQVAWGVELSNGTPYLLSLGLTKSLMALVWMAGPMSGALVQPYIGILSDRCRSPWGKRRPFMAIGTASTVLSLIFLAWVREVVGGILGLFGADKESQGVKTTIIIVAVLLVYTLDFAIATVQAAIRAYILDCAPSHQQETANSFASRAIGIGNIIAYLAGYLDLPKYLWFFGNNQFKILSLMACIALSTTVTISSATIKERDPTDEPIPPATKSGLIAFFKQVFTSIRRLPPLTRQVCEVEFFAWIGFFPQLFYSSSYVGDIYVQPYLIENPNMTPAEIDELYEKATRVGTFALLMYAITSLSINILLPIFITPSYDAPSSSASIFSHQSYTTRFSRFMDKLAIPGLNLRRAWLVSHLLFAGCMFSTLIVRSTTGATVLIALVGVSWAMTLWAPFAIISAEVSKRDAVRRARQQSLVGEDDLGEDQAGIILGIHNMSVAAPQILATLGSSLIFNFMQKPRGTPGDRSFSVVMAAGGISTLFAAYLTSRIKDEIKIPGEENRDRNVERREGRLSGRNSNTPLILASG